MLKKVVIGLVFLMLLLQLSLLFAKAWWFLELLTHYYVYYAWLSLFLVLLSLFSQSWKASLVFSILLSISLGHLNPYLSFQKSLTHAAIHEEAENQLRSIKILSLNFHYKNHNFNEFSVLIEKENPDLFIIHEAGEQWKEGLQRFVSDYPYYYLTKDTGIHGTFMASKVPGTFLEIPLGSIFALEFNLEQSKSIDGLTVLGVHPFAPLSKLEAEQRNAQLKALTTYAQGKTQRNENLVVMGDFNASPWSPYVQDFLQESGLVDTRLGHGILPTWHAHNALLKLPIDLAFLTSELNILNFSVGPSVHSDHKPIVLELTL